MGKKKARKKELGRKLVGYSAAAGAAMAVGGTAGSMSAEAAVHQFTPEGGIVIGIGGNHLLDFNNDGLDDLSFKVVSPLYSAYPETGTIPGVRAQVIGLYDSNTVLETYQYASVVGRTSGFAGFYNVARLPGKKLINTTLFFTGTNFPTYYGILASTTKGDGPFGEFGGLRGFIGVAALDVAGGDFTVEFGWVDVSVTWDADEITIHGWAYEDTGAAIQTPPVPIPGTLPLLASGAAGLIAWRRSRQKKEKGEEESGS